MSVIEKVRAESIRLRKERSPLAGSISFVLSEIEKVGKNNGNRATTEDEAIKVIQKIVANVESNLGLIKDDFQIQKHTAEIDTLLSFLPKMATEKDVVDFLAQTPYITMNKGAIMKMIRDEFGARVDMKMAGAIVDNKLGSVSK